MTTYNDSDVCPDARPGVKCLNCGREWGLHSGWQCYDANGHWSHKTNGAAIQKKSLLPPTSCYLTPDMIPVGGSAPQKTMQGQGALHGDEAQMQQLLKPKLTSNECPCGGTRGVCTYHP